MKTKLSFLILLSSFYCFSQDTDEPVTIRFSLPSTADRLQDDRTRIFTIKGTPYLNEEHQLGTIINGETTMEAPIRYNAYYDYFQVLDENKKKASVLKSNNVIVQLDGKTYHLLTYEETVQDKALYYLPQNKNQQLSGNMKEGYFCALSDGETVLYNKTTKRVPKFKLQDHGYTQFAPTDLVTLNHYYIKRKHRPAVRIKLSKKEVLFALNNKYNEVRDYIKKNKLKVKTEEEVIQILSYYDTLD
ncbi:hypothetical protein FEE95_02115 [Maribacter algarum]|uniref:GLPGLI family protein n=1 Tax=Maribacter algarum (ex Zhang et al. 2020) TaxID=2578118 RepID=A0A5S3PTC0_9FLAO|nr:hypothetical protein [Maribacter algarum]TMM58245.1 hypothetical protein FEE95_02115 [Maribacter algarum]